MFKTLAILTLIATPALANQVPFDQPDFLLMSGGDPVEAQKLSFFCAAAGKNLADCEDTLSGNGNLKQEAARKCVARMQAISFTYKFNNGNEIPGSRGDQIYGMLWHPDYRTDKDGEHRHVFTEADEQRARVDAESRQRVVEMDAVFGYKGTSSKTTGSEMGGGLQFGTGSLSPIDVQINVGAKGTNSTTESKGLLDDAAKKRIKDAGDAAYKNPNLTTVKPSVVCERHEKNCLTGDGSTYKNDSYEPKKDEKKGADNTPPKHESEPASQPKIHSDGPSEASWAGNDQPKSSDDPMIATSTEVDLAAKSPIENCLDKEFKKLLDNVGSKTNDLDAIQTQNERKKNAQNLLKTGYCDASFFGYAYCQAHKNKAATVGLDVILEAERKEAAESALILLERTGVCDVQALGGKFCRADQEKWITNPVDRLEIPRPIKSWSPSRPLPFNGGR